MHEAVTLMLKTSGVEDASDVSVRKTAEPIVSKLGYLALAIDQAGAMIRKGLCRMDEYCSMYSQHRQKLLSRKAIQGQAGYAYTVYTTWEVSRNSIKEMSNEAGRDALELLNLFSFLHYDGIPGEIFHRAWQRMGDISSGWMLPHQSGLVLRQKDREWDAYQLGEALSLLASFSLISRNKDELISIHPLVHTWARDRLSCSEQETVWKQAISTIALSIPRTTRTGQIQDSDFRRYLVPHIDACLGSPNGRVLRLDGSEGLSYRDRKFCIQDKGQQFCRMADAFAFVYREAGRPQDALQLVEPAMEKSRGTFGAEHELNLVLMHNLAVLYIDVGREQDALKLLEKVVDSRKKNLSREHFEKLLASMDTLAIAYHHTGRRREVSELMEQIVEFRKETLSEEHPSTLISMLNLARMYREENRTEERLQLTQRVVEGSLRSLDDDNPETSNSSHALTNVTLEDDREEKESLTHQERLEDLYIRALGDDYPENYAAIIKIAILSCESNRIEEALPLIELGVDNAIKTAVSEIPGAIALLQGLLELANRRPAFVW